MQLIQLLQKIYDSEINFKIDTFWDGGFTVKLGDRINGYKWESDYDHIEEGIYNLIKRTCEFYPKSTFAKWMEGRYFILSDKKLEVR